MQASTVAGEADAMRASKAARAAAATGPRLALLMRGTRCLGAMDVGQPTPAVLRGRPWVRWRDVCAGLAVVLATLGAPAVSLADGSGRRDRSYLAQLAMTLEGARRLVLWIESYPTDTEVARYAYPLADKLVDMASHLTPPAKLLPAHPHALLVVENVERALDAAAAGDMAAFRQHTRTVREELAILDGVLKQLKLRLPELGR